MTHPIAHPERGQRGHWVGSPRYELPDSGQRVSDRAGTAQPLAGSGASRRARIGPGRYTAPMVPPTPVPERKPASYQDIVDAPEGLTAEIIDGELVLSPRPANPHVDFASGMGILVGGPFRFGIGGPGGWIIYHEPEVALGDDVFVPDLAGWRVDRGLRFPKTGPHPHVPDWVCEVHSPSTVGRDRTIKSDIYFANGVRHLWLVDPLEQVLEVYRATDDGWNRIAAHLGPKVVRAEPFDAIELDLGLLWPTYDEPDDPGAASAAEAAEE